MAGEKNQPIPWECFGNLPAKALWVQHVSTGNFLDTTLEHKASILTTGGGNITTLEASVTLAGRGQERVASAQFDQVVTTGSGEGHSALMVITNQAVDGDIYPDGLLVEITVVTQFPKTRRHPAPGTVIFVSFGLDGKLHFAQFKDEEGDPDEEEHYERERISSAPEVKEVLRRMGLTDPLHQHVDPGATMRVLIDEINRSLQDEEPFGCEQADILSCIRYAPGTRLEEYWPPIPSRADWGPHLN